MPKLQLQILQFSLLKVLPLYKSCWNCLNVNNNKKLLGGKLFLNGMVLLFTLTTFTHTLSENWSFKQEKVVLLAFYVIWTFYNLKFKCRLQHVAYILGRLNPNTHNVLYPFILWLWFLWLLLRMLHTASYFLGFQGLFFAMNMQFLYLM